MLLTVLAACLAGVMCGMVTGLIPGVHTNLLASFFPLLPASTGAFMACWLVSMGVTHTVTSVLPNVYLGVCEGDDVVNVLPAHRLVGDGRGGDAVVANVLGGVVAATLTALYFVPLTAAVSALKPWVDAVTPWLLVVALAYLVWRSQSLGHGVVTVAVSGVLGYVVLSSALRRPLFPLLSGLFGAPFLLASDGGSVSEDDGCEGVPEACVTAGTIGGWLGGLTAFFPGIGSGIAGSTGTHVMGDDPAIYLGLTGAVNTADFYFSLVTLSVASEARNGVVVALQEATSAVDFGVLAVVAVVGVGLAGLATLWLRPLAPRVFRFLPYRGVCLAVVFGLAVLAWWLGGLRGLAVFAVSTLFGCAVHEWRVPKVALMSCIIVPVLLFTW